MTTMRLSEVLPEFNNNMSALARELDISRGAVWHWQDDDRVPELHALKLKHEILPRIRRQKKKAEMKGGVR